MLFSQSKFESPSTGPLEVSKLPEGRENEPPLAIDQIQGNILPGFNKDHQTLLFLRIDDPAAFAKWLEKFHRCIATVEEVLAFNRLFKSLRTRHGDEQRTVCATWVNIAFSFAGLEKLGPPGTNLDEFVDEAFKAGLTARSKAGILGDPINSGTPGDPDQWLIGGSGREPDVVLVIAGDSRTDVNNEVSRIIATLFPHAGTDGNAISSGASILFRQDGDTLTGPLSGHEHFGFKDGISQPGVRGLLPDGTPLTPCQNPLNPNQGKPGQDLLWPGEFVFGYSGQDARKLVEEPGKDPLKNPKRKAPLFARNGSFLVVRRLRQDVGGFHRFIAELGTRFGVSSDLVGARMVGRWRSGAPVVVTPNKDDPRLAENDCANNNFEFEEGDEDEAAKPIKQTLGMCSNVSAPAIDPEGLKCPFAGHIRKTYPRNDTDPTIPDLGESSTQTHRLMRRGIPYGPQSASTMESPVDDGADRGLLFIAYQTSIVDQFEFVTQKWVNNPDFKNAQACFDPIIGQSGDPTRRRMFKLGLPGETSPIETDQDWVIPTGGGYFFAPSIAALQSLTGIDSEKKQPLKKSKTKNKK